MTDNPVMRYVDVLKDRVEMLEKECSAANALIEEMEAVIAAYKKITNLTISINETNNDWQPTLCDAWWIGG